MKTNKRNSTLIILLFNKFFILTLCSLLSLLLPRGLNAQFTYVSGDVSYQSAFIKHDIISSYSSGIRSLNFSLKVTHRPIRNLGAGLSFTYPIFQKSRGSFYDAPSSSSIKTFRDFNVSYETSRTRHYKPEKYNYEFTQSFTTTVFAKVFFETLVNSYTELRFSYSKITEKFEFKRAAAAASSSAGAINERDIKYKDKHTVFAPGFNLGIMPHLTDRLFLDISFGMDFWIINQNSSFSYDIEYDWNTSNNWHDIVTLSSQLDDIKPVIKLNLGLGYYF